MIFSLWSDLELNHSLKEGLDRMRGLIKHWKRNPLDRQKAVEVSGDSDYLEVVVF